MNTVGQAGYAPPNATPQMAEAPTEAATMMRPDGDAGSTMVEGDSNAATETPKKARKSGIKLYEEFKRADKDGNNKLSAAEVEMSEQALKKYDSDGDGVLCKKEHRAMFHQQNSFAALDSNKDGSLSQDEMAKLRRMDSRKYDADGDGKVSQSEFIQARRAELKANKRANIAERMETMDGERKARLVEKFDKDGDGQVSMSEMMQGRREAREKKQANEDKKAFERLKTGGEGITLAQDENKKFKSYDADGNGTVSAVEFSTGRQADRAAFRDNWMVGKMDKALEERLAKPMAGANAGEAVNVGSLKDLTYDKALDIIKAQGGELPKPGKPTVLAIRTDNAGTRQWEDHFVVLKAGGEMQVFSGTTRPHFTTPSGGWNPEMLAPGNYELTPRWKDHKWNNAFIVNDENGNMNVRTIRDRNGDGRYSADEMKQLSSSNEIRLHPGSGGSPSSAGCLNVKDYDAFIRYLGGTEVRFDLTLING
jgi:Ca2+-binding EF-hand superfamily protein